MYRNVYMLCVSLYCNPEAQECCLYLCLCAYVVSCGTRLVLCNGVGGWSQLLSIHHLHLHMGGVLVLEQECAVCVLVHSVARLWVWYYNKFQIAVSHWCWVGRRRQLWRKH